MLTTMSDVRLVVWDLDETFWSGTLSEGGIVYRQANHDIVIKLCRRGVMNSICSNNDFVSVRDVLVEKGLWDYFVFPSIDWGDKGTRVAAIVAAARLRPESILFIDDNATNRALVAAAVPGVRVADENIIPALLADRGLPEKDDAGLTRLAQYKVLEARHTQASSGGDAIAFLRQSGVTVEIVYDVEVHIDRAVELINRTNQLNFTKERLPDDLEAAAAELRAQIAPWYVKAGLVSVRDRYGDYGLCGVFLVEGIVAWGKPRLRHFAFSCRTLGLGVEQWVYALLGRPALEITGTVRSDLMSPVDWINRDPGARHDRDTRLPSVVRIRGGCEVEVLEHFFRATAETVMTEVITPGNGVLYRPANHSALLARAVAPLQQAERMLLQDIGIDESFFDTRIFDACADRTLIVYSPTADGSHPRFRHRATGFEVPIWFRDTALPTYSGRSAADACLYDRVSAHLASDYEAVPLDDISCFESHYHAIVAHVPANALLVVVLPNLWHKIKGKAVKDVKQSALNIAFRQAASCRPNIRIVEMESLVHSIDEVADSHLHFNRAVYYRLYEAICAAHRDWHPSSSMEPLRLLSETDQVPRKSLIGINQQSISIFQRVIKRVTKSHGAHAKHQPENGDVITP